jgi:hypothetical protein
MQIAAAVTEKEMLLGMSATASNSQPANTPPTTQIGHQELGTKRAARRPPMRAAIAHAAICAMGAQNGTYNRNSKTEALSGVDAMGSSRSVGASDVTGNMTLAACCAPSMIDKLTTTQPSETSVALVADD